MAKKQEENGEDDALFKSLPEEEPTRRMQSPEALKSMHYDSCLVAKPSRDDLNVTCAFVGQTADKSWSCRQG